MALLQYHVTAKGARESRRQFQPFAKLARKALGELRVLRIGGEVDCLARIDGVVIKFASDDAAVFNPLRVATALGADGVAGGFATILLGERSGFVAACGVVQHGNKTATFDVFGYVQSSQLGEGWINIEKLGERHCFAIGRHSGRGDDERSTCGNFKVGDFAPQPVVAQVPTVIAVKQHDCILSQTKSIKLGEHAADLCIDVTDARKIAVAEIARVGVGEGVAPGLVGVTAHFAGVVPRQRGRALR